MLDKLFWSFLKSRQLTGPLALSFQKLSESYLKKKTWTEKSKRSCAAAGSPAPALGAGEWVGWLELLEPHGESGLWRKDSVSCCCEFFFTFFFLSFLTGN